MAHGVVGHFAAGITLERKGRQGGKERLALRSLRSSFQLRDDQRTANAELALIVSQTLPRGVETFDFVDGVWVSDYRCAIPVAIALRQSLISLSAARLNTLLSVVQLYRALGGGWSGVNRAV